MTIHAHGVGDMGHGSKETSPKYQTPDSIPNIIQALDQKKIKSYLEGSKVIRKDMLIIKCTLNELSLCKGIKIVLYDGNKNFLAKSNTGMIGYSGFEGLKKRLTYSVAIESRKYSGRIDVSTGKISNINGKINKTP